MLWLLIIIFIFQLTCGYNMTVGFVSQFTLSCLLSLYNKVINFLYPYLFTDFQPTPMANTQHKIEVTSDNDIPSPRSLPCPVLSNTSVNYNVGAGERLSTTQLDNSRLLNDPRLTTPEAALAILLKAMKQQNADFKTEMKMQFSQIKEDIVGSISSEFKQQKPDIKAEFSELRQEVKQVIETMNKQDEEITLSEVRLAEVEKLQTKHSNLENNQHKINRQFLHQVPKNDYKGIFQQNNYNNYFISKYQNNSQTSFIKSKQYSKLPSGSKTSKQTQPPASEIQPERLQHYEGELLRTRQPCSIPAYQVTSCCARTLKGSPPLLNFIPPAASLLIAPKVTRKFSVGPVDRISNSPITSANEQSTLPSSCKCYQSKCTTASAPISKSTIHIYFQLRPEAETFIPAEMSNIKLTSPDNLHSGGLVNNSCEIMEDESSPVNSGVEKKKDEKWTMLDDDLPFSPNHSFHSTPEEVETTTTCDAILPNTSLKKNDSPSSTSIADISTPVSDPQLSNCKQQTSPPAERPKIHGPKHHLHHHRIEPAWKKRKKKKPLHHHHRVESSWKKRKKKKPLHHHPGCLKLPLERRNKKELLHQHRRVKSSWKKRKKKKSLHHHHPRCLKDPCGRKEEKKKFFLLKPGRFKPLLRRKFHHLWPGRWKHHHQLAHQEQLQTLYRNLHALMIFIAHNKFVPHSMKRDINVINVKLMLSVQMSYKLAFACTKHKIKIYLFNQS